MAALRPGVSGTPSSSDRTSKQVEHAGERAPARAEAGEALKDVPGEARRARSNPVFARLARAGIGARAVIYVLLALMTADIATTHHSPSSPSGTGALTEVAKQPAGRPLIAFMAVGLLGYAAWRLAQALSGGKGAAGLLQRAGWAVIGGLYIVLCWRAAGLAVNPASSSGGGASQHPQPLVATVLRWPGGPGWVGLAGAALALGGLGLAVWGWVHDYSKALDARRLRGVAYQVARATGVAGEAARGALVVLVAVYLLDAAVRDEPSQAKSLGGALFSFYRAPAGTALLLLAAAGLVCFAVYSGFEARYRKL